MTNAQPVQNPAAVVPCVVCSKDARYVGTQDALCVYICPDQHLTRLHIQHVQKLGAKK